jgi:hypothetical protein
MPAVKCHFAAAKYPILPGMVPRYAVAGRFILATSFQLTGCSIAVANLSKIGELGWPPSIRTVGRGAGREPAPAKRTGAGAMAIDMTMPVLVVDDYNTMIRIIRNLLKQLGFEDVDDASDGSAALIKMRDKK